MNNEQLIQRALVRCLTEEAKAYDEYIILKNKAWKKYDKLREKYD
jgi:hypothetical protein